MNGYGLKKLPVLMMLCAVAGSADAVTVFGNATDYGNAVAGQLYAIDFNGSPNTLVDGTTISANVTFGSPEAADTSLVNWSSDALSDAGSTSAPNGVGPLSLEFLVPVFAFALDFSSASENETVELYDGSGGLIDAVLAPNASGFFGVRSATAISSVIIVNGIFPASGNPDRFFIDNLQVNAIPLPGAIWLAGSGLLALIGFSRRASAKAAQ